MGVDLKFTDEFTGSAAHAREPRGRIRASLEKIFHRGEGLGDATEIKLIERHRGRERIGAVANRRLERELPAAAEDAVGELAVQLRQADSLFFSFRPKDDFLGADTVGLRRADRQLERAALVGPEGSPVRSGRRAFL